MFFSSAFTLLKKIIYIFFVKIIREICLGGVVVRAFNGVDPEKNSSYLDVGSVTSLGLTNIWF